SSSSPAGAKFGPQWRLLIGEWMSEQVAGGGGGRCSFRFDLDQHVIVRTNHAELATAAGRPAGVHEDLMVIYPAAAADQSRAVYFDNEGHVIEYVASWAADGNSLTFLSKAGPGPQFRLIYTKVAPDTLTVSFAMA